MTKYRCHGKEIREIKKIYHVFKGFPPQTGRDLDCKLGKQNILLNRKLKSPRILIWKVVRFLVKAYAFYFWKKKSENNFVLVGRMLAIVLERKIVEV